MVRAGKTLDSIQSVPTCAWDEQARVSRGTAGLCQHRLLSMEPG